MGVLSSVHGEPEDLALTQPRPGCDHSGCPVALGHGVDKGQDLGRLKGNDVRTFLLGGNLTPSHGLKAIRRSLTTLANAGEVAIDDLDGARCELLAETLHPGLDLGRADQARGRPLNAGTMCLVMLIRTCSAVVGRWTCEVLQVSA